MNDPLLYICLCMHWCCWWRLQVSAGGRIGAGACPSAAFSPFFSPPLFLLSKWEVRPQSSWQARVHLHIHIYIIYTCVRAHVYIIYAEYGGVYVGIHTQTYQCIFSHVQHKHIHTDIHQKRTKRSFTTNIYLPLQRGCMQRSPMNKIM